MLDPAQNRGQELLLRNEYLSFAIIAPARSRLTWNGLCPSISLRFRRSSGMLFVFIVLKHGRRQVLHFNVREHPAAAWTSQQIVEAFLDRDAPRVSHSRSG
jgi:hypothetical protein